MVQIILNESLSFSYVIPFVTENVYFLHILESLEGTVASEDGNNTSREINHSSEKSTTNTFKSVRELSLGGGMIYNSSSVDMVFSFAIFY